MKLSKYGQVNSIMRNRETIRILLYIVRNRTRKLLTIYRILMQLCMS